jgi:hypothetical protein
MRTSFVKRGLCLGLGVVAAGHGRVSRDSRLTLPPRHLDLPHGPGRRRRRLAGRRRGTRDFKTFLQESAPGTIGVHAVCTRTPAGYQVARKDVLVG